MLVVVLATVVVTASLHVASVRGAPCLEVYDDLAQFLASPPCDEGVVMPVRLAEQLTLAHAQRDSSAARHAAELERVIAAHAALEERTATLLRIEREARDDADARWRACEDALTDTAGAASEPAISAGWWLLAGAAAGAAVVVVITGL